MIFLSLYFGLVFLFMCKWNIFAMFQYMTEIAFLQVSGRAINGQNASIGLNLQVI